jgi:predicted nucleotidyltransferase
MTPRIAIPYDKIAEFCKKNHIQKLSFFGSVLRDDFTEESDVDVLVEFEEGKTPGWAFFGMQDELSELLGRKVDLNTAQDLSKYFRDEVLEEARPLYVKAG